MRHESSPDALDLNLVLTLSFVLISVGGFNRNAARKAAVPKRDEKPIHGLVSDKNFIVANAVENILAGKCSFHALSAPSLRKASSVTLSRFEFKDSQS